MILSAHLNGNADEIQPYFAEAYLYVTSDTIHRVFLVDVLGQHRDVLKNKFKCGLDLLFENYNPSFRRSI